MEILTYRKLLLGVSLVAILLFISMYFLDKKKIILDQFIIHIETEENNYLIKKNEVKKLLGKLNFEEDSINLCLIERKLKVNHFIKEVEVSRDIEGYLFIDIIQETPIARFISDEGKQAYINESNNLSPLSKHYTARVLVITGKGIKFFFQKSAGTFSSKEKDFIRFIKFVNNDSFWQAQLSQIHINEKMEIIIYPQIGKEKIYFGTTKDLEKKFRKLKIFYQKVIPQKGWNRYRIVDLRYKDQLICK